MNNQTNSRILTFGDLWEIFTKRWLIMLLITFLCVGGVFLVNLVTFTPQYSSTATLYILRQDNNDQSDNAEDDFSLALKVINDCSYLLKKRVVLDEVIKNLNLDLDFKTLYTMISTSNPSSTRVLEVTVEADTPEEAMLIVNELCEVGQEKITEAMGFQQVSFYEHGTVETTPSNKLGLSTYLLVAVIAFILSYGLFLISFVVDDRIRTENDIQNYLGLTILADIPNTSDGKRKSKYKYGYGYRKRTR